MGRAGTNRTALRDRGRPSATELVDADPVVRKISVRANLISVGPGRHDSSTGPSSGLIQTTMAILRSLCQLVADAAVFFRVLTRPRRSVAAESLFLRKQLAMYRERGIGLRRADPASENSSWGRERLANELLVKLCLRVSPRTVRKSMWAKPEGAPRGDQRWATLLRNHADPIVACASFVVVTAIFRLLYVFVVMEHSSRRVLHCNVTRHPSARWTLQQFRKAIASDDRYEYSIQDHDSIFSSALDRLIGSSTLR